MTRFTKSVDGKLRTTIRPASVRLTRDELNHFNFLAKEAGYNNYREFLNYKIRNIVINSEKDLMVEING